jgi:hypothetical protein
MLTTTILLSFALTASPPPPKRDTVKALIKDAISNPAVQADGGAATPTATRPDVSKMPFTPDSIKTIVKNYQPEIQGCYEETLAGTTKAVEGTLKTSFVISPEGFVTAAKIDRKGSSLKDAKLHQCVVAVLSSMSFPKPPDGLDHPIEFPFNLKAMQ